MAYIDDDIQSIKILSLLPMCVGMFLWFQVFLCFFVANFCFLFFVFEQCLLKACFDNNEHTHFFFLLLFFYFFCLLSWIFFITQSILFCSHILWSNNSRQLQIAFAFAQQSKIIVFQFALIYSCRWYCRLSNLFSRKTKREKEIKFKLNLCETNGFDCLKKLRHRVWYTARINDIKRSQKDTLTHDHIEKNDS